jgi:hypothetical protein
MFKESIKELCLEVWRYFRDHPEIEFKEDLPEELWLKLLDFLNQCPFCEYFGDRCYTIDSEDGCPLNNCGDNSYYANWFDAKTNEERAKYAGLIVEAVEKW